MLRDYIDECIKAEGLEKEWENADWEFITQKEAGFNHHADRIEMSMGGDTRFSVYNDHSEEYMLKVIDTSA